MAVSDRFATTALNSINEVYNAGSLLLVSPVAPPNYEDPITHTLTISGTTAIGDTDIDLTTDRVAPSAGTWLRRGAVLHFGANQVVVTQETLVAVGATATTVPCEPLTSAPTGTATTWALLRLLSPTNIPLSTTDQKGNRTDLNYGLQGSEFKTKVMLSLQITAINQTTDRALWDIIEPASQSTDRIFCFVAKSGGRHAWGPSLVSALTDDGNIEEISRPQFTLDFQAPFSLPKHFNFLSTSEKTEVNNYRKLAGLKALA